MSRKIPTILVLAIVLPVLAACGSLWNRANVGGLHSDLQDLLAGMNIEVELEGCSMIGSTRSGYCRYQDETDASESIIESFQLHPVPLENATIAFIDTEFEAGCGSFPWILDGSSGELYLLSGRPQSLSLSNGTRFEYLLIVFEQSSGEACIQVSYAYG
jgi:hypothetical protein